LENSDVNIGPEDKTKNNREISSFDLNDLLREVNTICGQLDMVSGNSEQEFLEIGGRLQKYLKSSRNLTEASSSATSYLSGSVLSSSISELKYLLENFSLYFSGSAKEIKNDKEELLNIFNKLSVIVDELSGFKKIVKHLRMLGISTKIESSRLGTDDKGFNTLADNVDRLSVQISDKAVLISNKALFLLREIGKTTTDLEKLEKEQRNQSEIVLNNATLSLEAFEKKANEYHNRTERITLSSQAISSDISEIVTSIQFHDITRQQMEHSKEALEDIVERLKEKDGQFESEELNDELGLIHDIFELQSIQLTSSNNEFESAVLNIISKLKDVENNIGQILAESIDIIGGGKVKESGTLMEIRKELATISTGLKKNREIAGQLAESIKAVVKVVDDLTGSIIEIEDIGSEIEIIALNAIIKAAHAGSNGSALGVLAESIKKLSIDAKNQTGSTAEMLNGISEVSKKLKMNLETSSDSEVQKMVSTSVEINGLVDTMMEIELRAAQQVDTLINDVSNLKKEIGRTAESITIHNKVSQSVDQVVNGIRRMSFNIQSKAKLNSNRKENTKKLLSKYTMHSERNIHALYSESRNNPGIKTVPKSLSKKDDDLGDNVELF